ncbi:MAG: RNA polymerase sigma factor [Polyangiaceae bacterium]|jgi:RNA polymerase sigma-70 factor (ECF subfamily)|nr:RNA polymerase sigma factor [Polyangiaceae bacterium]
MTAPGQSERFRALLEGHKGILYKVCHAYCRNADDRDDLAQEIVVQLWQAFGRFDERARFSTWMYRIALNVAISFYRRESARARRVLVDGERLLEESEAEAGPSDDIALLYGFIGGLEPLSRALVLLYLDGHSHRDIAEVLGVSETNVGTKLGRLKGELRRAFRRAEGAEEGADDDEP